MMLWKPRGAVGPDTTTRLSGRPHSGTCCRLQLTFTRRPVSPTGLSHTVVDWGMAVARCGPLT